MSPDELAEIEERPLAATAGEPSAWTEWRERKLLALVQNMGDDEGHFDRIAEVIDAAREHGQQEETATDLAADVALRCDYGRRLGVYDGADSPPCWDDIVDAALARGRREREAEILAWAERQVAMVRADGKTVLDAAWLAAYQQIGEDIQRGAGRKTAWRDNGSDRKGAT